MLCTPAGGQRALIYECLCNINITFRIGLPCVYLVLAWQRRTHANGNLQVSSHQQVAPSALHNGA